jgi:hypothetical protein
MEFEILGDIADVEAFCLGVKDLGTRQAAPNLWPRPLEDT